MFIPRERRTAVFSAFLVLSLIVLSGPVTASSLVDRTPHSPGSVVKMGKLRVELVRKTQSREGLSYMRRRRSKKNRLLKVYLREKSTADRGISPISQVYAVGPNGSKKMKSRQSRHALAAVPTKLYPGEFLGRVFGLVTKSPDQYDKIKVIAPKMYSDSSYVRYFDISRDVSAKPSLKRSLSTVHAPGKSYKAQKYTVTVHKLVSKSVTRRGSTWNATYKVKATIKNRTDRTKNANVQENMLLQHSRGFYVRPEPKVTKDGYLGQIESIPAHGSKTGLLEYSFQLPYKPGSDDLILRFSHFSFTMDPPYYWKLSVQ